MVGVAFSAKRPHCAIKKGGKLFRFPPIRLQQMSRLGFDVFLDGQFAAVVTAFGTYVMHQDLSTTVAARGQLRSLKAVVRSSFSCSRL